jgi:hypothetical protein
VVITDDAVDPNKNDTVTYAYAWQVDGTPMPDLTGASVPADRTTRGEAWSVTVTPSDDKEAGEGASATVVIDNSLPSATVSIAPTAPLSTDDLNLTITTEDADGDTVNTTIVWAVDGSPAGITASRVPADRTRPGQTWEATVTPQDARASGEPVVASVMIENQAPTVETVFIRPDTAFEKSVLEAVIDGSDSDRDDLTYSTEWFVNGVSQGLGSDRELDGTVFDRGDTVYVEVIANDGIADSAALASDEVVIQNTPPSVASATVSPTEAYSDSVLTCTPTGWSDDDGDSEDYRYEWQIDGTVVATTPTADGTVFGRADRVTCAVIPFDGIDEGRAVVARPVLILNTPPELATVEIGPEDPESGTDITAVTTGAYDLDGDDVTVDIDWYVDGRKVASGATLPAGSYIKKDAIYAIATPNDGIDDGLSLTSNTVTAVNAAPTIVSFSIDPVPLFTEDDAGIAIETDDWDGDTITIAYEWTLNGTSYGDSSTTKIPFSETKKGDVVEVKVTINDGDTDGDSASDTQSVKLVLSPPEIAITPADPEPTDDLFCEIITETVDGDGDDVTYTFTWYVDGVKYTGSLDTTDYTGDTVPSTSTSDQEEWTCDVYAESTNGASVVASETVTVADRDGQARTVSGTWIDVRYEKCGSGTSGCTVSAAKSACGAIGGKVVSHASNGTTSTYSLGATTSCNWSISYYTVDSAKASGDCLVGVSNLDWTSCCGTSRWHGNTIKFGSTSKEFGYVSSGDSGYSSSYTNSSGTTWGCSSLTTPASSSGCSQLWVACTK